MIRLVQFRRLNPARWFSEKTWVALGIACSILFGIVSLWFSWRAVQISEQGALEQLRQFSEVQEEKLSIALQRYRDDPLLVSKQRFGPKGQVVYAPWKLQISNIGQQRLSIIGYELSTGTRPGSIFYTGLDGGIWDEKFKRVDPTTRPVALNPGDTIVLTLRVGMLVKPQVADILTAVVDNRTGYVLRPSHELALKGLDLNGDRVEYQRFGEAEFMAKLTNYSAPRYWLKLVTGRNGVFVGSGSDSAYAIQGLEDKKSLVPDVFGK